MKKIFVFLVIYFSFATVSKSFAVEVKGFVDGVKKVKLLDNKWATYMELDEKAFMEIIKNKNLEDNGDFVFVDYEGKTYRVDMSRLNTVNNQKYESDPCKGISLARQHDYKSGDSLGSGRGCNK